MTAKVIKDRAASVRERLLNLARRRGEDFQITLRNYLFERFLYRLSLSEVNERFVLKGAMLLRLWAEQPYRATADLDLLSHGNNDPTSVGRDIATVCQVRAPDEAVFFDQTSIFVEPTETVIAEKLEAIVSLGIRNSRIKDFFDIDYLARTERFERLVLIEAIRRTFARRATQIPRDPPIGLTAEFWKQPGRDAQVKAFARRARLPVTSEQAIDLGLRVAQFALPLLQAAARPTPASN